jgi:hypothetical protein
MPSRNTHKLISRYITGESCELTHVIMDYPVKYLRNRHRILFHDPVTALVIGILADGYKGGASGLLHIATDYIDHSLRKYKPEKRK